MENNLTKGEKILALIMAMIFSLACVGMVWIQTHDWFYSSLTWVIGTLVFYKIICLPTHNA